MHCIDLCNAALVSRIGWDLQMVTVIGSWILLITIIIISIAIILIIIIIIITIVVIIITVMFYQSTTP